VVFPGGFGTMDELFEILTLVQTRKLEKKIAILLYGTAYWNEVINFDAMVKHGTIGAEDVNLFDRADDPATAFEILKDKLTKYYLQKEPTTEPGTAPDIAKSRI
jgi:predicted Rossmann-fold nucleotide-binding protein